MADGSVFDDLATPESGAPSPDELSRFELNDIGNAMRLIRLAGGRFDDAGALDLSASRVLYLQDRGWIAFTGKRWDLKEGERVAQRLAHKVAEGLYAQGAALLERKRREKAERDERAGLEPGDGDKPAKKEKPDPDYEDFLDFARTSGNAGKTESMLKQARTYLTAPLSDFDKDPLAINCRNGTVKIRRGKAKGDKPTVHFAGHNPADRITRMAEVEFDPAAVCKTWDRSLKVWQPADDMRGFLSRISGYSATGYTFEQVFFLFQGLGRDGKSTFVGALRELLGDLGAACDVKTFLDVGTRSGSDANPDMARLAGDTRLISCSEPPRGAKLAEAMIKSFTGGAPILARQLRQDPFEFTPLGKIIMECNSFPAVRGDDEGIWRRLVPILWENQLPKDKVDRELPDKLRAEYPGIFNWLITGVCAWLVEGLNPPKRIDEALEDYRKGSSPFGEWLAEWVVFDKAEKTPASFFYTSFKDWLTARDPDARVMSQQAFGRALADRQIIRSGLNGVGQVMRTGARLKTKPEHDTEFGITEGSNTPGAPRTAEVASAGGSESDREFAPRDSGSGDARDLGRDAGLPAGDWDPAGGGE